MSLASALIVIALLVALSPILWIHQPSTTELGEASKAVRLVLPRQLPTTFELAYDTTKGVLSASLGQLQFGAPEGLQNHASLFPVDVSALDFRFLSHAIIDEKHKLLVCAVPKVASSEFKKLFLRLKGDPDWLEEPWWKMRNLTTLYKVGMRRSMEIMTDPTWTKGVFFRDPLKRLLSCYLDKFTNGTERAHKYSVKVFGANHTLTFDEFLDKVASGAEASAAGRVLAIKVPLNVHWRPQADICQVGTLWHLYNVHGNFEHLQAHAEVLLRRAGVWPSHGAHGWPGDGRMFSANGARHRSIYSSKAPGTASGGSGASARTSKARLRESAAAATDTAASTAPTGAAATATRRAEEQDPYAVYSSALSTDAVQSMAMQQARQSNVESNSPSLLSPARAKATATLLRRVKVAYRADYALFAHLAAAKAHPFDASLYFPPIPHVESQAKSIESSSSSIQVNTEIIASSTGSTSSSDTSSRSRRSMHSSGGGADGDRRNTGRRPNSQPIDDTEGGLNLLALQDFRKPVGKSRGSHRAADLSADKEWQDDAEMDDDEVVLRVRDPEPLRVDEGERRKVVPHLF